MLITTHEDSRRFLIRVLPGVKDNGYDPAATSVAFLYLYLLPRFVSTQINPKKP
jgi:hypothetical protein